MVALVDRVWLASDLRIKSALVEAMSEEESDDEGAPTRCAAQSRPPASTRYTLVCGSRQAGRP